MARGSMKAGSHAWKERELRVLAAKLRKTECPHAELESFLQTAVKPELRDMARNYFTELMAVK